MSANSKNKSHWLKGKVTKGLGLGRELRFPTLNLDHPQVMEGYRTGVYTAKVQIGKKVYRGLLYFGPKYIQGKSQNALEIYVLDFQKIIYQQTVSFCPVEFIRPPIKFTDAKLLQKQMESDLAKAK